MRTTNDNVFRTTVFFDDLDEGLRRNYILAVLDDMVEDDKTIEWRMPNDLTLEILFQAASTRALFLDSKLTI